MNRLATALVTLATVAAALPLSAQTYDRYGGRYSEARVVSCNSDGYRDKFCPVDTRGGVRLVRQVSNSRGPCIEGRTWGYDRRGIWVTDGCRAEFEVGSRYGGRPGYGYPDPAPRIVRCESIDKRENFCPVRGGRIESVDIQRRLSRGDCTYGQHWGFTPRGIWVDRGCRADFIVY
jgi:hypothetical protein